jgi:tetratricopeptide (TPR) repeat protein
VAEFCVYHPGKKAWCYCGKCGSYYCADCSRRVRSVYGKEKVFFFCPKCNIPAEMLSAGSFVDPFWKRLPRFFAYPFQLRPLGFILILPLIAVILHGIPLLPFFLSVIQLKYCFDVLNSTANGCLKAPEVSYSFDVEDIRMVFKLGSLITIYGAIMGLIFFEFGKGAGVLCLCFLLLLMPAMIIALATSKSLLTALNPFSYVTFATRIGVDYLLMCLFLLFLLVAPGTLLHYARGVLPLKALLFVSYASTLYYTIISYNLMGYVILQYHEQIGYEVDLGQFIEQGEAFKDANQPAPSQVESAETVISRSETLVRAGQIDDALWVMENWMRTKGVEKALSERYYNLLKITRRTDEMLSYSPKHLDLLAAADEKDAACAVYRECLSCDPEFAPAPQTLLKIGKWLIDAEDPQTGSKALLKFLKANMGHPLAPNACFFLAKALHEKLNNSAQAERLLKTVIEKYPHHDLAVHAERYLGAMKMESAQAG